MSEERVLSEGEWEKTEKRMIGTGEGVLETEGGLVKLYWLSRTSLYRQINVVQKNLNIEELKKSFSPPLR